MLHQTAIVVIGFYVVQWEVETLVKYSVIGFAALLITLLLYDLGVPAHRCDPSAIRNEPSGPTSNSGRSCRTVPITGRSFVPNARGGCGFGRWRTGRALEDLHRRRRAGGQ